MKLGRGLGTGFVSAAGVGLLMALTSGSVFALGLGEARVDSYLNQPLDVRIRLLDASELELDSLTVGPASPEDFQRLGVGSAALALDLEVEVDRSVDPAIVRITSARPVTDPIVQLLVDGRWASGRILREYTLFLDPPTLEIAPPIRSSEPSPEPSVARTEPERETRPAPAPAPRTERPRPAADAPPVRARDGGERLVQSGDTLWSIAQANLPAADVSMDQMMLAIVELNPQAFRNGNIHQLLRGSRLALPDAEQARAVDRSSAAETVRAQNRAFNQRLGGEVPVIADAARGAEPEVAPSDPEPAPRPAAAEPVAAREPEPEGRLELVPAGDDASGSGLDGEGDEVSRLRQQLARTEEELFTARLEAEDFRGRLQDLEAMVQQNPNGVGIADADLAGLQETLRAARLAAAEDADPELRAEVTAQLDDFLTRFESAAESPDAMAAMAMEGPDADPAADDPMEVTEGASDAATEPAAPEPVVTQVGSSNRGLMSNPLFLPIAGLLALLVAIGGGWIALQRRRREAEDVPAREVEPTPVPEAETITDAPMDPVERTRSAVAAAPSDLAAHLALLQALAGRDDQDGFESALEDMFEHVETGEEDAWRDAVELAATVAPEHVLVKGSADWIAGPDEAAEEPLDALDEESEVGDLMSRLESESDAEAEDESSDSDWVADEAPEEDDRPMLRDTSDADEEPLRLGDIDDEESVAQETESEELSKPRPADVENESSWLGDPIDDAPDGAETPAPAAAESSALPDDDGYLSDWTEDTDAPDAGADQGEAEGSDIFAPSDDDVDVKLDLARAYLSWNSTDSAKTLLEEVLREGNYAQKEQAKKLLNGL